MKKWLLFLTVLCALGLLLTASAWATDFNVSDGFKVSWQLDPRLDPTHFTHGPGFAARGVLSGMDLDRDGRREILFLNDETQEPGSPPDGEGRPDVFLYEATGDDQYEFVWSFTSIDGSYSLPYVTYGDMDKDGLYEIFFITPSWNIAEKLFVFEQNADGVFPDAPTLLYDYGRVADPAFRPAALKLADADNDGDIELVTVTRTSPRELIIISLATEGLDEFASFQIEFEAGNDLLGGGSIYDCDVIDFDGDGKTEVWVNTWDLWSMTIFEATAPNTYELQVDLNQLKPDESDPASINSNNFLFDDMDDDGRLEVWFPMTDGMLYFIDDIDDVAMLTADHVINVGRIFPKADGASRGADLGDIDRDGNPDIICGGNWTGTVNRVEYLGHGDPADSTSYEWSTILTLADPVAGWSGHWYSLSVADVDLDGDGYREIVLPNYAATEENHPMIVILEYTPETAPKTAANWSHENSFSVFDADSLYAADYSGNSRTVIGGMDLDKDGAKELIVTDYAGSRVLVMEYNNAENLFEVVWTSPQDTLRNYMNHPRFVNIADFDGDDRWEIVFPAVTEPSGYYVYEWDGVVGSDNYGTVYSSLITSEIEICCPTPGQFRAECEASPMVKDIDGDGKQEAIIAIRRAGTGGRRGILVTSVEGSIEFEGGGSTFETWVQEFYFDHTQYGGGSPYQGLPADLDGDGTYELVNHTWNYFNLFNLDVVGPDTYAGPDTASATRNYQATYPNDHVSLFGGDAGDVNGDGDDEAFFTDYNDASLWVVDYKAGDDVLSIDASHVVKVLDGFANFHTSIFDVDQNGYANILGGGGYPNTIVSAECLGEDAMDPDSYMTHVIYTGEPDDYVNFTVRDSAGIKSTSMTRGSRFASKTQAHIQGNPIDFDNDGKYEVLASFQSNADSITTTNLTWNEGAVKYDTVITKIVNPKAWSVMRFEFGGATGIERNDLRFVTPEEYVLAQNYPNPFNPATTISFTLPVQKKISVRIYNALGQLVRTLVDNQQHPAGKHTVQWDGTNDAGHHVASGVYLYALQWGNFQKTSLMTLVK